jgi:hypothetical protein
MRCCSVIDPAAQSWPPSVKALKQTSGSFIAAHFHKWIKSLRRDGTLIWISKACVSPFSAGVILDQTIR